MANSLSATVTPVMANFYMEFFEQQAINSVVKEPAHWYRYIDETCVCTEKRSSRDFFST